MKRVFRMRWIICLFFGHDYKQVLPLNGVTGVRCQKCGKTILVSEINK